MYTIFANIPSSILPLHAGRIRPWRSQTFDLCREPSPFKRLILRSVDCPAIDIGQLALVAVFDQWRQQLVWATRSDESRSGVIPGLNIEREVLGHRYGVRVVLIPRQRILIPAKAFGALDVEGPDETTDERI
jgi:hypothetical protein